MPPLTNERQHFPALDGLRGVAILLVVLYHNFGFIQQSYFGWLGVDLFFVLSGFLITSILLNEIQQPGGLKKFYVRRILRIFPLYFLCLLIFLVLFPAWGLYKSELQYFTDHQWWLWTYLENWLYSFRLRDDAKMLTHLWSLAVEEQFYLVWPFVVLLVKSPRKLFVIMSAVLALLLVARSVIWLYHVEDLNYTTFYTFTRIDGICIGSMIALLMRFKPDFIARNLTIIVISLASLNFIFYFINRSDEYSYPYFAFVGYTTFCALFGLLLYEIVKKGNKTVLSRLFSLPLLRFFGKISYGFYIFHWPVFLISQPFFLNLLAGDPANPSRGQRLLASLASTLIAFLVSVLSYYGFERFFLRLKQRFRTQKEFKIN